MSINSYAEATAWLFQQFPSYQLIGSKAYKPTLENTHRLLELLGNPEKQLRFVHVAGSNGKGSVCSMTAAILTAAGYRTGLFTSPHIVDYRERIRINGTCIDEQRVIDFVRFIQATQPDFEPSFFEVTFALALQHFAKNNCDICVIETGLGGRLDATNVITPLVSAITSISLEHTQLLGDTLEAIATEKAGIIKPGVPVVLGRLPEKALKAIETVATRQCSPVHQASPTDFDFRVPLLGSYQISNFSVVLDICQHLAPDFSLHDAAIQKGLDRLNEYTGFMGRLQVMERDPLLIFDVSHNAEGISASLQSLEEAFGPASGAQQAFTLHIVYGASKDKDLASIVPLFPADAILYPTEFNSERSMSVIELEAAFNGSRCTVAAYFTRGEDALRAARASSNPQDILLVTGSFFLLSDFFEKNYSITCG